MKTVLAIAVVSCLFVIASSQDAVQCARRATELSICLAASVTGATYCTDCGSKLRSYYNDCLTGTARTTAITSLNLGESKNDTQGPKYY